MFFFFFQAEDGIRDVAVTGVQTCALPISELLDGPLLQRSLSPDRTRRHDVVHIPGREPKACQVGRRRYGVSQVLSREGAVVDETTPMLRTHFALECGVLQRLAAKRSGSILMSPSRPTERSRRRSLGSPVRTKI